LLNRDHDLINVHLHQTVDLLFW